MADIFGFETTLGDKGFIEPSDGGVLIGTEGSISLVQDWNVGYNMSVNPIYECGTSKVYWSAKHASGSLTVNRVIADNEDLKKVFGWICNPAALDLKAYTNYCKIEGGGEENATPGGAAEKKPVDLVISGCILAGVTYSGNSQQAYVSEGVTAQFSGLEVKTTEAS